MASGHLLRIHDLRQSYSRAFREPCYLLPKCPPPERITTSIALDLYIPGHGDLDYLAYQRLATCQILKPHDVSSERECRAIHYCSRACHRHLSDVFYSLRPEVRGMTFCFDFV